MTTRKVAEKIAENQFFQKFTFSVHYSSKGAENIEKRKLKKIKKIIYSQRPCKWLKNVFRGELKLVRCFFFRG